MEGVLEEFNFHFENKADQTNQVAYALSCKAKLLNLRMLDTTLASFVATSIRKCIKYNMDKDLVVQKILKSVHEGKTYQFWEEDGLLIRKKSRIFVHKVGDLRRIFIKECHYTL